MADRPRIPPATNGIEQRLDALIAANQEIIDELKRWNERENASLPAPVTKKSQEVQLREPVTVPKMPEKRR